MTVKSALDTFRKSQWSPVTLLLCCPSLQALPLQELGNLLAPSPIWVLMGMGMDAQSALLGVVVITVPQIAALVHDYYLDSIFEWTDAALTDGNGATTGCCPIEYKWPNTLTDYRCWLDCLVLPAALLTDSQVAAANLKIGTYAQHLLILVVISHTGRCYW